MSLRQEYVKNKISLHEARKEEVKDWLNENVVFINERMDRARVKRLINLMLKFDQKFGPFKDKIPGITSIVADAENALQMALSGRLSNAKIGDIFQRLSIIYSILSDFFANDLKVLLQTPAFKVPRTKPEVRLDSITDSGYSPKHITDTLVLTLSPSEEEMVFLNKLYKGITLPQLDRHSIANQMLGLSYKDLEGLCGMEQVPMAVVPDENLLNEQIGQAIKNVLGGAAAGGAAGGAAGSVVPGVGTALGAGIGAAAGSAKAIYDLLRSPQTKEVYKTMNNLQATTDKLKIPSLSTAMKNFRTRLNAAMNKKNPTKTDSLVLSQAIIVAEFYKNLSETLKELQNDPNAETLDKWSENITDDSKKNIDGVSSDGTEEAKAALGSLQTFLDSTLEDLNPEGGWAKIKAGLAKKAGINAKNTLPDEFRTQFSNIKDEIINIILKESSTLRESHFAHKRKNNFINFNNDVNKILNEGLKDLTAIVNSLNTAANTVAKGGQQAAAASPTSQGAGGQSAPQPQPQAAPAAAPGGGLQVNVANFQSLDQAEITTVLQMYENAKNETDAQAKAQYDILIPNIDKSIKGIGVEGTAGTNTESAIKAILDLSKLNIAPEKLNNTNKLTPQELASLSTVLTTHFGPKPLEEQLPNIAKLTNAVRGIDDLIMKTKERIDKARNVKSPASPAPPVKS